MKQPSSHPRSSPALHPFLTYLINACPSGGLTGGGTVSRSATTIRCFPFFSFRFLLLLFYSWVFSKSSRLLCWLMLQFRPVPNPVLIHPTQRAENGCKCMFLKGQSHGDREGPPGLPLLLQPNHIYFIYLHLVYLQNKTKSISSGF